MSAKKSGKSVSQRAMSTTGYAYAFLLILQTILIGVSAENHLQQGDSRIEILLWMIKESISLVKQASSLQEKQKKSLLPRHRHSKDK
ncbi:hypothetical protein FACHB389_24200 [Nostoc calcicola FACHB-389]|nr:hypothetical protein FACHB389_24200 [Nostoc calcicola FACHB-389]